MQIKRLERRDAVIDALGVNGGFGLHLNGTALRTFIRSDFTSIRGGQPDLVSWLQDASLGITLKQIAGFESTTFWRRGRPELVSDSGDISSADLDTWVAQNGVGPDAKQFTLFCMQTGVFQDRLDTAKRKGEDLAIFFNWTSSDVQLVRGDQVLVNDSVAGFLQFLTAPPFNRHRRTDLAAATDELCTPVVIGVFRYRDDSLTGLSAHLFDATCVSGDPFPADGGATAATSPSSTCASSTTARASMRRSAGRRPRRHPQRVHRRHQGARTARGGRRHGHEVLPHDASGGQEAMDPQLFVFRRVLRTLAEKLKAAGHDDGIALIFDDDNRYATTWYADLQKIKKARPEAKRSFGSICFGDDHYIQPLLGSDVLAYLTLQFMKASAAGQEPPKHFTQLLHSAVPGYGIDYVSELWDADELQRKFVEAATLS